MFYVLPCVILFLCFSVLLALRLPRLGKRELILVLFVRLFDLRLFISFFFFFFCLFPVLLGVWEGLRFVIVALPGLFSYFFIVDLFNFRACMVRCYGVPILLINMVFMEVLLGHRLQLHTKTKFYLSQDIAFPS